MRPETATRWRFDELTSLYYCTVNDYPEEKYRALLGAGNFKKTVLPSIREGVSLDLGVDSGICLLFHYSINHWCGRQEVYFDFSNELGQIDSHCWKVGKEGIEIKEQSSFFASHIYYHRDKFYTVPGMRSTHLDGLFLFLKEREDRKNMLRVVK